MGNSFVFPAPKCNYTADSLFPFYLEIPGASQADPRNESKKETSNIPALYMRSRTKSKYLFIYTHGNSEDLGRMYDSILDYYERFLVDIIAPEYPGYGILKGKTTAKCMIECVEQTILYATSPNGLNYDLKNIILIGRSIGTGLAVEMAAKFRDVKGLILISAFLSVREIAQSYAGRVSKYFVSDMFKNDVLIEKIVCPTLLIHGKKDELIPFWHATGLYDRAKCVKRIFLSTTMTHNRCKTEKDIYTPIKDFLFEVLKIRDLSIFEESKVEDLPVNSDVMLGYCKMPSRSERKKLSQRTCQIPLAIQKVNSSPIMADKSEELTDEPILSLLRAKSTNPFGIAFQMRSDQDALEIKDCIDCDDPKIIEPEILAVNSE